jgi:hypothetical protein
MSFGQGSGPPASAKQLQFLLDLLQAAGHDSFREARYPLGLTQRQAGGKFTTKEASELIDQLTGAAEERDTEPATPSAPSAPPVPSTAKGTARSVSADVRAEREAERAAARMAHRQAEILGGIRADMLADELVRRGWVCIPPE